MEAKNLPGWPEKAELKFIEGQQYANIARDQWNEAIDKCEQALEGYEIVPKLIEFQHEKSGDWIQWDRREMKIDGKNYFLIPKDKLTEEGLNHVIYNDFFKTIKADLPPAELERKLTLLKKTSAKLAKAILTYLKGSNEA